MLIYFSAVFRAAAVIQAAPVPVVADTLAAFEQLRTRVDGEANPHVASAAPEETQTHHEELQARAKITDLVTDIFKDAPESMRLFGSTNSVSRSGNPSLGSPKTQQVAEPQGIPPSVSIAPQRLRSRPSKTSATTKPKKYKILELSLEEASKLAISSSAAPSRAEIVPSAETPDEYFYARFPSRKVYLVPAPGKGRDKYRDYSTFEDAETNYAKQEMRRLAAMYKREHFPDYVEWVRQRKHDWYAQKKQNTVAKSKEKMQADAASKREERRLVRNAKRRKRYNNNAGNQSEW